MNKKTLAMAMVVSLMAVFVGAQDRTPSASSNEPQMKTMPAQKMLVVESKGDPNVAAMNAFSILFKTFFSIPGARMAPPRARWQNIATAPKNEWVGLYALPLPEQVTALPPGSAGAKIDIWQYGEVAEILHVGGYDKEMPVVEKLVKYIKDKGYEIAGPHEEEYLKGPESGPDTSAYQTIIRYQVRKK
ncbi:MAG: GyrI-like domain-containing protein [Candidatus Aminicenantales bacterium]